MALLTYADLTAAVADWLMRDDLTARIPDFIAMGEDRMAKDVRVSDMETVATSNLGNGSVALPADFIEAIRIMGGGAYTRPLQPITTEYAGENYFSTVSGVPERYSITGNTLTTYPNGGSGAVTMIYYARPQALDLGNATNWLYAKAPTLYLSAALVEANLFMQNLQQADAWEVKYKDALARLQGSDERKKYASSVSRVVGYCP